MKNNKKLFFWLFFLGIFFLENTGFANGTCQLKAPESCYFVNTDQSPPEKWLWGNLPGKNTQSHCELVSPFSGDSKNKITLTSEICSHKDITGKCDPNTYKINVETLQSILSSFINTNKNEIWPDLEMSRLLYQEYNKKIPGKSLSLPHWDQNGLEKLNCANNFLSDGKYGHCTQYALQLYLDQECLLKEKAIIIGNGEKEEILTYDENGKIVSIDPESLEFPNQKEQRLGFGSCNEYVIAFREKDGTPLYLPGIDTENFCAKYAPGTSCNFFDMAGANSPENDYEVFKTQANKKLKENCSLLVLGGSKFSDEEKNTQTNSGLVIDTSISDSWKKWGSDYEAPNGTLHDCNGSFTMVFEKTSPFSDWYPKEPIPIIKTKEVCSEILSNGEECNLENIILSMEKKNPEKNYLDTNNYHQLKIDISRFLKKSCTEKGSNGFKCESNPDLKIPGISFNSEQTQAFQEKKDITDWLFATSFAQNESDSTPSSEDETIIFAGIEICKEIFRTEYCTIKQIRDKIETQNQKNPFVNYWDASFLDTIANIPPGYITEAKAKNCKTKTDAENKGRGFDVCTRLALSKYLLAEKCADCDKAPKFYEGEKYKKYQEYIAKPNAKTICLCGEENFDYTNMVCKKNFFQWNEDQLRPKYLTGSNWENRKYKGDASDLNFWMQKLGNKVTSYAAILAVLFIVYNGFMLVTAAGEEDQIKKAKDGIKWTTIGLILLSFAYIIVKTVISLAY